MVLCPSCKTPCLLTDVTETDAIYQCECGVVIAMTRSINDFIEKFRKEVEEKRGRLKLS